MSENRLLKLKEEVVMKEKVKINPSLLERIQIKIQRLKELGNKSGSFPWKLGKVEVELGSDGKVSCSSDSTDVEQSMLDAHTETINNKKS